MAQDQDQLHAMRHSLAHITATAVQHLWPQAKFGVGPVVENGFYYDIDLGDMTISEDNFGKIEKEMKKIIAQNQTFERTEKSIVDAIAWAKESGQPYKQELLNDLSRAGTTVAKDLDADELGTIADEDFKVDNVSFYTNGDFTDLCRGPHVESTGKVGAFKLLRVAGAYWRGKEGNPQMQRLYGVAFETQDELDKYLEMLKLAKERDHRKLGKELDLFVFSDLVGSGLPLYTPRGTTIRNLLIAQSESLRKNLGFQGVWSPHITKKDLYEKSGHWAKFGDELFLVNSQETTDELVMKPMNCPHHAQIYAAHPRSYRDLPLKYMETTTNYRDEKTGELHGLSRVRSLTQDDSHTYCTEEQVAEVFSGLIAAIQAFYDSIDMKLEARLSLRDESDAYLGEQKLWDFGQQKIEEIAKQNNLSYYKEEGEAAFYGPKIDFMAIDAIGRKWQVATIQFDFVQPERFSLAYVDASGEEKRPYMIHCAIMGSFDRFFSVFIEHTGGWFPFWLAPEQVRILTINDTVMDYVDIIKETLEGIVLMKPLKYNELRYSVDDRNESLGRKIRDAAGMKIPVTLIVGPKDVEAGEVSVRLRDGEQKVKLDSLKEFLTSL
jgi:threonyl-tRNA synthetase